MTEFRLKIRTPLYARALSVVPVACVELLAVGIASIVGGSNGMNLTVFVLITGMALALLVGAWRSGAYIEVGGKDVRMGFSPLWRTRLPRSEIEAVDIAQINAARDYGGWGIKGSPTAPKGMLYSVGGGNAISVHLRSGRRYLVAFHEGASAAQAVVELLRNSNTRRVSSSP